MYENRVKYNKKIFFKFAQFYLENEEIHSREIQNNLYILNYPALFYAEFPHLRTYTK